MEALRSIPMGRVRMVNAAGAIASSDNVGIQKYGGLYTALGATSEMFRAWEDKYGMDSLGVSEHGSVLLPEYPVFSKVAWTYIDHVDLSGEETQELIHECERAMASGKNPSVLTLLSDIRRLAIKAQSIGATLRFGPP
jgi:hypothetical protein